MHDERRGEQGGSGQPTEPPSAGAKSEERRVIFVVDDDEAIVETLRDVLLAEGYAVEGYVDPIQALERLRAGARADVVVLDCVMPAMDGRRFMEVLAEEGRSVPIVLVTALCDPGFCVDPRHPLAAAVINKPFDLDRLLETLAEAAAAGPSAHAA